MPFTPLHMGPGILIKSILQGSFSLMVFGWTQIVMDLQPLFVMITGEGHLHGFSHTYIGASLIALFSALSGKYLSELGLKILGINHKQGILLTQKSLPQSTMPANHEDSITIVWLVAFFSAFVGSFSHVFLDSIMHTDVEPFFPFTLNNYFHALISIEALHQLCLYSGLFGAAIYFILQWRMNFKKPQ